MLKAFVTFDCSASTTTAGAVLAALSSSTASKVEVLVSFANLEPRTKKHNIVIERSKMIQKDCTFVYFCHYCSEVTWLNGFSLKRLGTGQFRSESLRRTRVLPEHAKMKDVCCKM